MNEELAYKRKKEVDKLYDWLWNMAASEVSMPLPEWKGEDNV